MDNIIDYIQKFELLHFIMFVSKQANKNYNVFTCIRCRSYIEPFQWTITKGKRNIFKIEACFNISESKKILKDITGIGCLKININGEEILIFFGELKKRPSVFMPNYYKNPVANGWWPGTLEYGCTIDEWVCSSAKYNPHNTTIKFIRENSGFDLEKLSDFLNTVLLVRSLEKYKPLISFNPDTKEVLFILHGEVEQCEHLVVIKVWDTNEAFISKPFNLSKEEDYIAFKIDFSPIRVGFDLFKKEVNNYELVASIDHMLITKININMGLITGKLIEKRQNKTIEHDIVSYLPINDVKIKNNSEPWKLAEQERIKLNRTGELKNLGSIFIRKVENESKQQLFKIIYEVIFNSAHNEISIWDPYLDSSVLGEIILKALKVSSMKFKLLLSEHGNSKILADVSKKIDIDILREFKRSSEILHELTSNVDKPLQNVEIRNWFRNGSSAFHDRFIITDFGVWHLGSSLKDIGNYHSTIYRMDDEIGKQVKEEFSKAWKGDLGDINAIGFSIAPELKWLIPMKEGENNGI